MDQQGDLWSRVYGTKNLSCASSSDSGDADLDETMSTCSDGDGELDATLPYSLPYQDNDADDDNDDNVGY